MESMENPKPVSSSSTENAVRKQRIPDRTRFLSALLTIAETATQSLQIDKILNDTLDKSLEILDFDVGSIRVLRHDTGETLIRIDRGFRRPPNYRARNQHRLEKLMIETKRPHISADIRKDPIHKSQSMQREGIISAAHVPIISKNRVFGSLTVGSRTRHKFSLREIELLKAFGAQLGMSLENAQFYDEVRQGKLYLENLLENAGEAIITTDNQDRVLSWNRAAEVMFGYGRHEMIGGNLGTTLPSGRSGELEEIRLKVEVTGPLRNLETRRMIKGGNTIDVALAVSPIKDSNGVITGFLHMVKDITEKNRYERRLKELDKMKSDFVSNVSHELRTPLTAIKGSVDNMLDGIVGAFSEKQVRYLARIRSNTDRLSRLIGDLLDLSRIEAGKVELRLSEFSVITLLREVADTLRVVAAEKLINIDVGFTDPEPRVRADRDKVAQVLLNLLGNAIKFTPSHGNVSAVVEATNAAWIKISVVDDGPGISDEDAAKIFDKSYQVNRTSKQELKGTGLGLAIAKALVELHGGRIWFERGTKGGSVFSFTLPVLPAKI